MKPEQRPRFEELAPQFKALYAEVKVSGLTRKFVSPLWSGYVPRLEEALLPAPAFSFLRRCGNFLGCQGPWLEDGQNGASLRFLESNVEARLLKDRLLDEPAGAPVLTALPYLSSYNSVHQLFHLTRYSLRSGADPAESNRVVEWGGGYGNMARIWRRMRPSGLTYTIIDLPLVSCLQWLYLSSVFGEQAVHLIRGPGDEPRTGLINLLPVTFLERTRVEADFFLSTWALSECSAGAQEHVFERDWFSAKRLLLAYQPGHLYTPDTRALEERARRSGASVENLFAPPATGRYAFL
ncbi:MAG: hypothetical protein ACHQ2Z_00660 [Elusimicrobiota bacterium]